MHWCKRQPNIKCNVSILCLTIHLNSYMEIVSVQPIAFCFWWNWFSGESARLTICKSNLGQSNSWLSTHVSSPCFSNCFVPRYPEEDCHICASCGYKWATVLRCFLPLWQACCFPPFSNMCAKWTSCWSFRYKSGIDLLSLLFVKQLNIFLNISN